MSSLSPEHIAHIVKLKAQTKRQKFVCVSKERKIMSLSFYTKDSCSAATKKKCMPSSWYQAFTMVTRTSRLKSNLTQTKFQIKHSPHYMSIKKSQPRIAVQIPKKLRAKKHEKQEMG